MPQHTSIDFMVLPHIVAGMPMRYNEINPMIHMIYEYMPRGLLNVEIQYVLRVFE